MELLRIKSETQECSAEARNLLKDALQQGFKSVVIVGIRPDGASRVAFSRNTSSLETLGALELAKGDVLDSMDE